MITEQDNSREMEYLDTIKTTDGKTIKRYKKYFSGKIALLTKKDWHLRSAEALG